LEASGCPTCSFKKELQCRWETISIHCPRRHIGCQNCNESSGPIQLVCSCGEIVDINNVYCKYAAVPPDDVTPCRCGRTYLYTGLAADGELRFAVGRKSRTG
jgi:hypothetical protein